jgi:hypothetical protein
MYGKSSTGNNGVTTVSIELENVIKFTVYFPTSGGIANIDYTLCDDATNEPTMSPTAPELAATAAAESTDGGDSGDSTDGGDSADSTDVGDSGDSTDSEDEKCEDGLCSLLGRVALFL